jgi:hypothetical protein
VKSSISPPPITIHLLPHLWNFPLRDADSRKYRAK